MSEESPDRQFVLGHASFTPRGEGDQLLKERIIILGELDAESAQLAVAQLLLLERDDPAATVTVYVNCASAPLDPALSLYDTMQMVSCPLATVCTGVAAEAAVLLMASGAKGQRAALPHSRFVMRMPPADVSGDVATAAEEAALGRRTLVELIAGASGKPEDVVRSDLERGRFLTAPQAVEYGLVDEMLEQPPKAWRAVLTR
ncbi:MAG: ATP-dependent Clp protease proteolytic subunit [Candidatus Dormiibacterota bacterium]